MTNFTSFAGRHNPLLDLTKPLYHNHFGRWMYFPRQAEQEFSIRVQLNGGEVIVDHDFRPSRVRQHLLESNVNNVLRPLLESLRKQSLLRADWEQFVRSSLLCCPFLTVNLFAAHKADGTLAETYSQKIKWLGLTQCIAIGSEPETRDVNSDDLLQTMVANIFDS